MKSAILVACLALGACVSSGVTVNPDAAAQFKVGETTEAEVIRALGAPTNVTANNAGRFVTYAGSHVQTRAATFIPIVGALAGGSDVRVSYVQFRFGTDGRLAEITSSETHSGSVTGAAAGREPQTAVRNR
jgi:outer membrane protein assembly factor BamE (lipoprotein component of BamABCDE complex)